MPFLFNAPRPMHLHFRFHAARAQRLMFLILAGLIAMHAVVVMGHFVGHMRLGALTKLFDVDCEGNVPTLYNVLLFLFAALLFFLIGSTEKGRGKWAWYLMGGVMVFLGVDEGSQIHERFMNFTLRLLGDGEMRIGEMGWLFYAWTIPYLLAAGILAAVLLPWLWKLDHRTRNGFLLAGVIYVLGAAGMEAYGGKVAERLLLTNASAEYPWLPCEVYPTEGCFLYADPWYVTLYTIEEALEMTGLIICIGVLINVMELREVRWDVRFGGRAGQ